MVEEDGSESLFQKLYMRQRSRNSGVLSSSLNRLGALGRAISLQDLHRLRQALAEEELSIVPDRRANTNEADMAPYVTVRGAEPVPPPAPKPKETEMAYGDPKPQEEAEVEAEAIFLADADRVEKLLDIIQNTVEMPNIPCIRAAAQAELAQIEHDLWVQMYPEQAEAQKKAEEERQKAEAERQKKLKEEQEKERKRQAKLKEEEKEDA